MILRRLVSIPTYIAATLLLTLLFPIIGAVALVAARWKSWRGAPRALSFFVGYLWCETAGILISGFIWMKHIPIGRRASAHAFLQDNYELQCWWVIRLTRLAERIFALRFEISGQDALEGSAAHVLPRHTSMADTVIPMAFYAVPRRVRLRYVLKKELLWDPCLDIVGHRLPNYFVDRRGADTEVATRAIQSLARHIGNDEAVLIYPEGTRWTAEKHHRIYTRTNDPVMRSQLERWPDLLPPRLGGTLALLAGNPERDLLFCAHTGFEPAARFQSLVDGSWQGAQIRIHFWRVPYGAIPSTDPDRQAFLFTQWDRMQQTVAAMRDSKGGDIQ